MSRPRLWLPFPLAVGLLACPDDPTPAVDAGLDPQSPIDPLSMPEAPSFAASEFNSAETCQTCHPEHYAEWRLSTHAYAMKDPLFRGLVMIRQQDFQGERDAFCTQCHSAIGTRSREIRPGFRFEDLSPIVQEGVTCEACHKVTEVARRHNSGHRLDPAGPMRGPIADPMPTGAHASLGSELYERPEFCAGCHEVVEYTGLPLERPYTEWRDSPAAREDRTCQDCHLPTVTGPAAKDGPTRERHRHDFIGVDVPLSPGVLNPEEAAALREKVQGLLRGTARLDLTVPAHLLRGQRLDLVLTVHNLIAGHSLPTGSTFHRQLWLEVTVTDVQGTVVYRSGHLDDDGDLRDHFSALDPYGDPDLVRFGSRFVDERGNPTLFPWKAAEHFSTAIPPGYARTQTLFVDTTSAAPGRATVVAALRFRPVPPFLLRLLGLGAEADALPIYSVTTASAALELE